MPSNMIDFTNYFQYYASTLFNAACWNQLQLVWITYCNSCQYPLGLEHYWQSARPYVFTFVIIYHSCMISSGKLSLKPRSTWFALAFMLSLYSYMQQSIETKSTKKTKMWMVVKFFMNYQNNHWTICSFEIKMCLCAIGKFQHFNCTHWFPVHTPPWYEYRQKRRKMEVILPSCWSHNGISCM